MGSSGSTIPAALTGNAIVLNTLSAINCWNNAHNLYPYITCTHISLLTGYYFSDVKIHSFVLYR